MDFIVSLPAGGSCDYCHRATFMCGYHGQVCRLGVIHGRKVLSVTQCAPKYAGNIAFLAGALIWVRLSLC